MTLDEAVTALRGWIPDFTGLAFSDDDLKDLLGQGANEIAALTLCYERKATYTSADATQAVAANVRELLLGGTVGQLGLGLTDALRVISVHIDTAPLVQIVPGQYSDLDPAIGESGTPHYWYEFAGRLGFRPIPDEAFLQDYELEVTYAAEVGTWSSGELALPPGFHDLALTFAYIKTKACEALWQDMAVAFQDWVAQVQTQPLVVLRPATRKGDLAMPPTERRRLRRKTG